MRYYGFQAERCRQETTESVEIAGISQVFVMRRLKNVFNFMFLITIFLAGLDIALFAAGPFQWHDT